MTINIGSKWTWRHDQEHTLIYLGKSGKWNQFELEKDKIWCEVLDDDVGLLVEVDAHTCSANCQNPACKIKMLEEKNKELEDEKDVAHKALKKVSEYSKRLEDENEKLAALLEISTLDAIIAENY